MCVYDCEFYVETKKRPWQRADGKRCTSCFSEHREPGADVLAWWEMDPEMDLCPFCDGEEVLFGLEHMTCPCCDGEGQIPGTEPLNNGYLCGPCAACLPLLELWCGRSGYMVGDVYHQLLEHWDEGYKSWGLNRLIDGVHAQWEGWSAAKAERWAAAAMSYSREHHDLSAA